MEPEAAPLVGEWEEGCTEFQKMLFIRSCRPDRISFCITTYIVRNLSQGFVEPPVLDLKAVLDDSVPQTPLIFVLSPGVDPTSVLMQLADSQGMTGQFMMLSLGQGQVPIATRLIRNFYNIFYNLYPHYRIRFLLLSNLIFKSILLSYFEVETKSIKSWRLYHICIISIHISLERE